jgi:hypothetical protein
MNQNCKRYLIMRLGKYNLSRNHVSQRIVISIIKAADHQPGGEGVLRDNKLPKEN